MRRNRILLGTLALLALFAIPAPAALAGGPLLSGYGGPGAGAQAIIGGTLLNGPRGALAAARAVARAARRPPALSFLFLRLFLLLGRNCSGVAAWRAGRARRHGARGSHPGRCAGGVEGPRGIGGEPRRVLEPSHSEASLAASVSAAGAWFTGGICWRWCWRPGCSRSLRLPPCVCRGYGRREHGRRSKAMTAEARLIATDKDALPQMDGPRLTQQTPTRLPLARRAAPAGPRRALPEAGSSTGRCSWAARGAWLGTCWCRRSTSRCCSSRWCSRSVASTPPCTSRPPPRRCWRCRC